MLKKCGSSNPQTGTLSLLSSNIGCYLSVPISLQESNKQHAPKEAWRNRCEYIRWKSGERQWEPYVWKDINFPNEWVESCVIPADHNPSPKAFQRWLERLMLNAPLQIYYVKFIQWKLSGRNRKRCPRTHTRAEGLRKWGRNYDLRTREAQLEEVLSVGCTWY